MRILFVWPYWQYPQVAVEFLERVRDRGHEVHVLVGGHEGGFDLGSVPNGIDVRLWPKWDFLSRMTGTPYPVFKRVSDHIRAVEPDVVHINSHLFLSSFQAARASHLLGVPYVVTVHGFSAKRGFLLNALQDAYAFTVARWIFENASAVICLTKGDAASVAGVAGGYDRISIIPNGVDTELFRSSSNKDPRLIAWVGRLVPEKGLIYLLRAMREVAKEKPDAKLALVGDGILRDELERQVHQLGLGKHVSLLGTVDRTRVAEILSEASVFAFPSLREGLPFSVLEAMACGVPVVGSNISGVSDLVRHGETGLLVPPRDSGSLSRAILILLGDGRLRKEMNERARRTIAQEYSWSKVMEKMDAVYNGATAERIRQGSHGNEAEPRLSHEDLCVDPADSD